MVESGKDISADESRGDERAIRGKVNAKKLRK